ncbi:MAG TPA: hypothetical protein VNX68_02920 [Nitrosopumilaceae archaeon]|nr:hypothetical protein [Nitrosopumilaceae archaeon]
MSLTFSFFSVLLHLFEQNFCFNRFGEKSVSQVGQEIGFKVFLDFTEQATEQNLWFSPLRLIWFLQPGNVHKRIFFLLGLFG